MNAPSVQAQITSRLRRIGLRPTRQRIDLASLMFVGEDHHMTAESLHKDAADAGVSVSLATVYNTLHQFTAAGLLREIVVDSGRSYFDTNTSVHHHFFFEDKGILEDIPSEDVVLSQLPDAPTGSKISRIDVIVRVTDAA